MEITLNKEKITTNFVTLICIKDHGKLRVRIISDGYNKVANCQFPRNIRKEGTKYSVPVEDVSFNKNNQMKFFYRVKATNIKILNENVNLIKDKIKVENLYKSDEELCCVCYELEKSIVFAPCGHFYCCSICSDSINKSTGNCPICREAILHYVTEEDIL